MTRRILWLAIGGTITHENLAGVANLSKDAQGVLSRDGGMRRLIALGIARPDRISPICAGDQHRPTINLKETTMESWTQADEHNFKRLSDKRREIMSKRRAAVLVVAELIIGRYEVVDDLVDALITNADGIRDALAPFDSGVRCANSED